MYDAICTDLQSQAHTCSSLAAGASVIHELASTLRREHNRSVSRSQVSQLCDETRSLVASLKPLLDVHLQPTEAGELLIDSEWLSAWLLREVVSDDVLPMLIPEPVGTGGGAAPASERTFSVLRLIDSLCVFVRYVIFYFVMKRIHQEKDMKGEPWLTPLQTEPLSRRVDLAKLRLLTELAHCRGVSRAIPMFELLSGLYPAELVAYAAHEDGAWRQDLFHAQDVTILGDVLLRARAADGVPSRRPLWRRSHRDLPEPMLGERLAGCTGAAGDSIATFRDIERNWFVAGLLHDVGIAPETAIAMLKGVAKRSVGAVREMLEAGITAITDKARELRGDEAGTTSGVDAAASPTEHGMAAAGVVTSLLAQASPGAADALRKDYRLAVGAIAAHNRRGPTATTQNPVSPLLVVCDLLQEWGRPRLDSEELAQVVLSLLRHPEAGGIGGAAVWSLAPDHTLTTRAQKVDDGHVILSPEGLSARLVGGESAGGVFQPAVYWVDATERLQGVAWPSCLPSLTVCFEHTYDPAEHPSEMSRLDEFVSGNQKEFGYLETFLEALQSPGDCRVGHKVQSADGTLSIETFHVRVTTNTPRAPLLILRQSGRLYGALREWQRRPQTGPR